MNEMWQEPGRPVDKKRLREEMLQRRRTFSARQREACSHAILERLYRVPGYRDARTVMAYVPMRDEVQLFPLLEDCLQRKKRLFVPLITGNGQMEAVGVPDLESLTAGAYGIPTVREGEREILPPEMMDCVIVPGAAFSRNGKRLGLGGGYYDRFLRRCPQALRIAPAFSLQLTDDVPTEPHDMSVDVIVTEKECIRNCTKIIAAECVG